MKNIILAAIIVLFTGIMTSCTKKGITQADSVVFSNNPFSAKSILATAD